MNNRAFIQFNDDLPINVNCFVSMQGFLTLGYQIVPFSKGEPVSGNSEDIVVHGEIQEVRRVLRDLGKEQPKVLSIPPSLVHHLHRASTEITLGQIRENVQKEGKTVFIKPAAVHKAFNGHVVSSFRDLIRTASLDDSYVVVVQDVVTFLSEWRSFVLHEKIVHLAHYMGDPLIFPQRQVIEDFVQGYSPEFSPVAYSADFGVLENGKTALVEVNDAFSLGAYGMSANPYARLIEARWKEIIQTDIAPNTPL